MKINRRKLRVEVPTVAMGDIAFNLLIFFLVATRFDQEERQLPVTLPEVAQAQPLSMTQEVVVNITREGQYFVAQNEYTEDALFTLLRTVHEKNPHQSVLIRSDGDTSWKYGVRVMGLCNKAGIENYRVAALEVKRYGTEAV